VKSRLSGSDWKLCVLAVGTFGGSVSLRFRMMMTGSPQSRLTNLVRLAMSKIRH
jgi:hypothetical protein